MVPIWALNLIPFVKRYVGHFLIYLFIGLILFGSFFATYQYGWRKGYSQCAKDRPTYGNVGTVINQQGKLFKWFGIDFEAPFGIQFKVGH